MSSAQPFSSLSLLEKEEEEDAKVCPAPFRPPASGLTSLAVPAHPYESRRMVA